MGSGKQDLAKQRVWETAHQWKEQHVERAFCEVENSLLVWGTERKPVGQNVLREGQNSTNISGGASCTRPHGAIYSTLDFITST